VTANGDVICEAPIHYLKSRENWEANACLIAAAPDLLVALKLMRNINGPTISDVEAADAAIAKAEGL
jgi:hypothetical protein